MCFSMVMMMLLTAGCISIYVTQSRPFEEFGLKDLSFSDLGNLYRQSIVVLNVKAAKVDFHGIIGRINHLAVNCVSFTAKATNVLWEGEKKIGPNDEVFSENRKKHMQKTMTMMMIKMRTLRMKSIGKSMTMKYRKIEDKTPTDYSSGLDSEYSVDTQSQGDIIAVPSVTTDDQSTAIIIPQAQESESGAEIEIVPSETVETEKPDGEIKSSVDSLTEAAVAVQSPITKEISSIFAAILSVDAAFVVYQYRKISSLAANNGVDVKVKNKQEMNQEKAFSSYSQRKVDDNVESSCPSEMSSFQNSKREETRGEEEQVKLKVWRVKQREGIR
ncbi:hypothetical protein CASFOL_042363 [Castilleja foliolosa]|uniref:Uncharacterized protein n=1 Tax=Castilleja foliolosa TaxID=1961234 RepID=A0ABD3BAJ7_9LAMI